MANLNTGDAVVVAEATTETPTAETVTPPASDSTGRSDRDVIVGYSAENKRLKKQLERATADNAALVEKHKTEEQRQIDAKVEEQVGPQREEIKQLRDAYFTEIEQMNAGLPEKYRRVLDPDTPIQVLKEQRRGIVDLLAETSTQAPPATYVDTGGNPPAEPPKGTVTKAEFAAWQQLVSSGRPDDIKRHNEMRPAMEAAYRERRIR
ncbi:MAG: hypothetical protein GY906_18155 [bacterium]|nr:hypothetical protein [bacterium]